ncbi:MAG: cyclic nucleotide-binding domain-containing protein [Acidobacteria bacterium]|nr:cyclic nucleotide-binding domain-containing protein [Acidobacteriota bacterium]
MNDQTPYQPILGGTFSETGLTALQRAEILRGADIFSKATVEELLFLAAISSEVRFDAGTAIFQEGDIADALYIIIEGRVERIHSGSSEALEPNETFGIYAVLTGETRYASARALEQTHALKIGAQDFYDLLSHNTEIVQSLFKLLIQRIPFKRGC